MQVENAKQLTVSANEGTKNELSDGGTDKMNAAFFSNDTVIFEGKGELRINGNNEHGVESDDDIIINGSDIVINAVNDALHATDNITINGGNVTVEKSEEGMESKNDIIVNGGNVKVNSNDDALNASNDITINGGEVYAVSAKGDAIDSNGTIHITGGTVTAIGADMPEASIDCDGNNLIITGGTIIGAAGSTSMPTSESSTQPSVILAGATKGETISISDESGELMTFTADKSFSTLILARLRYRGREAHCNGSRQRKRNRDSFSDGGHKPGRQRRDGRKRRLWRSRWKRHKAGKKTPLFQMEPSRHHLMEQSLQETLQQERHLKEHPRRQLQMRNK